MISSILKRNLATQQLAEAIRSDNPVVELPIAVETAMFRLNDDQIYVPISAKLSSNRSRLGAKTRSPPSGI